MREQSAPEGKLLACPFCGGAAYWEPFELAAEHGGAMIYFVGCKPCKISRGRNDPADAVAWWNHRAPDPAKAVLSALRRLEWSVRETPYWHCPACWGVQPDPPLAPEGDFGVGHRADCYLAAALRAAGEHGEVR